MVIAPDISLQERLGADANRYQLMEEIGQGSMGRVYLARCIVSEGRVAVKLMNESLARDPFNRARFHQEADILRQIQSPHVIRYVGHGEEYLVTEFFEGINFKKIIARRSSEQLDAKLEDYLHILINVSQGLQDTHGVAVHRDVKPANFLVDEESVRLCDFGIAQLVNDETTFSLGTPLYMSPEAITGNLVDKRADVYSFGIVLYESLVGLPPFTCGNVEYHHLHTDPEPPTERLKRVPRAIKNAVTKLEIITLKCLAKKPEDRFQNMEEVKLALIEALSFLDQHC